MVTVAPSFLIESSSFWKVTEDMHKCLNGLEFLPDPCMTPELAALERMKNQCLHFFSVAIDPNLSKL